jgi:hypothetical protein
LQPLAAGAHVAQHFALPRVEPAEFLALQQFDVSVENRQRGFEIVSRRGQGIGGAFEALAKLGILLRQLGIRIPTGKRVERAAVCSHGLCNPRILRHLRHNFEGDR